MLFMLCVTPILSSQMQLCSPLSIQILLDKEISAGKSGEIIWKARSWCLLVPTTSASRIFQCSCTVGLSLVTWCKHTYHLL